jgi:hypothetical protein
MMKFFRTCLLSFSVLTSLVFVTSAASAVELGSCTEDCECTSKTSKGYDSCSTIAASELLGVDDPHQLRDALNLTTVYNENTDTYELSYDVSDDDTKILTLHPNQGEWQSLTHLNDYANALVFGPTGPPDNDLPPIDFCDLSTLSFQQQIGYFGRWDQFDESWAPFQLQNVLFAAVSDADGVVHVDGEPFVSLSGELLAEHCEIGSNTDGIEAEQCSIVEQLEGNETDGLRVCGEQIEYPTETGPRAQTDLDDLKRNGLTTQMEEYWSFPENERMWRIREVTETMRLQSQFYYGSSERGEPRDTDYQLDKTELHHAVELADAVCSKGEVDEGVYRFSLETAVGGAPLTCPDLDN